jgi:uncharacterized membrane protein HdeD (DUF308 family)
VRDIIAGVVLIGIGLAFGGSVFLGDFSLTSIFFDGLGLFFIVKGIVAINRAKREAASPSTPAPPPTANRPR